MFRITEDRSPPAASGNANQPLSSGGMIPSLTACCLALTYFASAPFPQTPSNNAHDHQPNGGQPAAPTNPIRNTRVGEPFCHQPALPPPSPHPTDPSAHQTGPPSNPSHPSPNSHSPLPSSTRPTETIPAHPVSAKMMRRPKGITKKGLKQSMGLHLTKEGKHAYNRFRVSRWSHLLPFPNYCFSRSGFVSR